MNGTLRRKMLPGRLSDLPDMRTNSRMRWQQGDLAAHAPPYLKLGDLHTCIRNDLTTNIKRLKLAIGSPDFPCLLRGSAVNFWGTVGWI